jgi:CheY-like chemotaxis protein
MLVDDEAIVRRVTSQMLKRLGYDVLCAESGEQAVQLLEEQGDDIALVVLDMVMPGMDGRMTLSALRQRRPDLKVLLASGFVPGPMDETPDQAWDAVLLKPYRMQVLAEKLREVLDGCAPPPVRAAVQSPDKDA